MVGRGKKKSKTKRKKGSVFNHITSEDALGILRTLAEEDKNITRKIERIAKEYQRGVDPDGIASDVYFELDHLEVEELWDRSGRTRHGYVDPADMAWEMFEEALEPFLEEMRKYQKLSMAVEAKNYCMGILKGIYRFEKESYSEFIDWAGDAPRECFETILDEWKKSCKDPKSREEMGEFIKKNFRVVPTAWFAGVSGS
jgi:hypothetical protein